MAKIALTRREFLHRATVSAGVAVALYGRTESYTRPFGSAPSRASKDAGTASQHPNAQETAVQAFRVTLPHKTLPMPEGVLNYRAAPGFKMRGIKGWAWVPAQYLDEIPVMAKYKMNFLMNCYASMWNLVAHGSWAEIPPQDGNHWYEPLPKEKKRAYEHVVRECQRHGIDFCFSMNPILSSDRPFDYDKPQDLETLWQHYAWMQSLGVKWFNLSLDDIAQGIDAAGQAKLLNELSRRLRAKDPAVQMIFCPTWYAGPDGEAPESSLRLGTGDTPGILYTRELAEELDPAIFLYWTGPEVCSLTITAQEAEIYKRLSKHRIFIWDNYPVNDQHPTLHLGPLMGRDPELAKIVEGYISNPLSPQNDANRIPMLTVADYLWNPAGYDPARSIGQAVAHLGHAPAQRLVLKELVELYPGRLVDGSLSTGWNSLRDRFRLILQGGSQEAALSLIVHAEGVSRRLAKLFPNRFVLARKVLDGDTGKMRMEYAKRYPST